MLATTAPRASVITDRAYWLRLARAHWKLGNRSGFSSALDNARRAPIRPDLMAARLAHTDLTLRIERAITAGDVLAWARLCRERAELGTRRAA